MSASNAPLTQLPASCDIVIVGSGYGGSVAAARLATAGRSVCVIEKGRAFRPGDFARGLGRDVRIAAGPLDLGPSDALQQYTVGDDMTVAVGVGLGGGSLINSGVVLRPDSRIWGHPEWPEALRGIGETELEPDYQRALATLAAEITPAQIGSKTRLEGVRQAAKGVARPFAPAPVTISFAAGPNQHAVAMNRCVQCGECNSGCNHGAKGDLTTNYHAIARAHGASFYTELTVTRVERRDGRWLTRFIPHRLGREAFGEPDMWIMSDQVVLAAGTLGTVDILLRSRDAGLSLSDKVGHRFSANGCGLGFSHGGPEELTRRSEGDHPTEAPGPGVTSYIDGRGGEDVRDAVVVQDGLHPRWANTMMRLTLGVAALRRPKAALQSALISGSSLDRGMNWLLVGHDDSQGRIERRAGRLVVR